MAIEQTQVLPAPVLEAALTAFTQKLPPLMGQQINTAAYNPQVAAQSALQQQAQTAAQGLGSLTGTGAGPATQAGSIASYMSPYQNQVMDATLAEFDRKCCSAKCRFKRQRNFNGSLWWRQRRCHGC